MQTSSVRLQLKQTSLSDEDSIAPRNPSLESVASSSIPTREQAIDYQLPPRATVMVIAINGKQTEYSIFGVPKSGKEVDSHT